MNRNKLKSYAPEARRDFIQAVTDRAALYGLTAKTIEPMTEEGDVAIIAGRAFPKAVGAKRKKLAERIGKLGFEQTIEAMAYTWFNRLVAIRYMELHGYLEHGYRVLSAVGSKHKAVDSEESASAYCLLPTAHSTPEVLSYAEHVDLPGLDREKVIELKLDGTKEEELYRMLLIAQCNALHRAMPFLFESIDDETELLLPDHLLHSDSLVRKLVGEIPEEDWQEVEIIGWLYQFYVIEEKKRIDGYSKKKPVARQDVPSKTQLFTPKWIVKYLVQNSLGRQWVATYPNSPLKTKMEYYIEPAEQTAEVHVQLDEITPTSLNPEELTLLDPACGSGHILVEAYDLLKAIYQERGYRAKDIPRLILEKNLFGLEIDDRAAQLAACALMMKARADDHRIFATRTQPNVLSVQGSSGEDPQTITESLNAPLDRDGSRGSVAQADVAQLIELFHDGRTCGSLIRIPKTLATKLLTIAERSEAVIQGGGMLEAATIRSFVPIVKAARRLATRYDIVSTNPPYLGGKAMPVRLKDFAASNYSENKSDLFAMFTERALELAAPNGFVGMVTMHNWMFLSSYEHLRNDVVTRKTLESMLHLGPRAFGSITGEVVQTTAFCMRMHHLTRYRPTFFRLTEGVEEEKHKAFKERENRFVFPNQDDFTKIPGAPLAYWATRGTVRCFVDGRPLSTIGDVRQGMATTDNPRFLRYWHEVDLTSIAFNCVSNDLAADSDKVWFPYNKGGTTRKWYGNTDYVVKWQDNGKEIADVVIARYGSASKRIASRDRFFQPSASWSKVGGGDLSVRFFPPGFIFDVAGCSIFFPTEDTLLTGIGLLNSIVTRATLGALSNTINCEVGHLEIVPLPPNHSLSSPTAPDRVRRAIGIAKRDWGSSEASWEFAYSRLLHDAIGATLRTSYQQWTEQCSSAIKELAQLEEENNQEFVRLYGLEGELTPRVPEEQVTLYRPDQEEDIKRLISYAIGCMMGRYSLDEPGLIYAHIGNEGFDPSKYQNFPADDDGIVPLTKFHWFEDDAAKRFEKFIATAWPDEHLPENLQFVAESLGPKRGESPREMIRRYLAADFFKHHLSLYKKRPIYWLFSSGKQRGFQALVYLHRYNEGTLARMRTEYVIPLLGKIAARIDQLTDDIAGATSSQHRKRLEKEKSTLTKQLAEVQAYDEKLRHYADQRITLDLDDGVKVNYGKFGDLLAEVKAVTGKKPSQ